MGHRDRTLYERQMLVLWTIQNLFKQLFDNLLLVCGMSEGLDVEQILGKAAENEKQYEWLGAAEFYGKALSLMPGASPLKLGQVQERLSYAFYRAAMQAESVTEFRDRMSQSVAHYEEAKESYEKMSEPGKTSRVLRCDATIAYIGYWLASEVPEKKRLLEDCWRLAKESLKAFKEAGDALEYGKTYNQLSNSVVLGFCLEWDFQAREKLMREAVEHGEQAIKFLSALEEPCGLARAYAKTAFYLGVFDYFFLDVYERQRDRQKALDYWQKAKELCEDVALFEFLYPIFGAQFLLWGDGTEEAFTNLKKALEYGRKTRDKFIIGCVLDWLVYHINWEPKPKWDEDPEERSAFWKTMLQYAEDAKRHYATLSFISPRGDALWIETTHIDLNLGMAFYETDLRKKRSLLEKARETYPDRLRRAEASGYPDAILYANHMFGTILTRLAEIETNSEEEKRLLEEALEHRQKAANITEQLEPFLRWNRGIMKGSLAWTKHELADLAKDHETKKSMLQKAILDVENSLKLCIEEVRVFEKQFPAAPWILGYSQYKTGVWLNSLYELTSNKEHLRKATEAFAEAAEWYQKVDARSRIAECHWKAAQTYDALGEHSKATENFDLASDNYKGVSERISQLKDFYQEYALYMQAWSEIEKARHHHDRQEYGGAKEHYEKAANMHKSLKQWSYLAPNYSAWAQVENAEDLSRSEKSEEALQAFEEAAKLFTETKKSLETKLGGIENLDEKTMTTNLIKASDIRREYCLGRMTLEEAKILDKKGDHFSSSQKYDAAAQIFEKITQTMESEQEKKEFKLIATLSQAWQRMTRAEAEGSPHLYLEASQLFEEAKDLSPNEQAKTLTLGHSRFCKALEVGTRFVDTRDPNLHTTAIQHLESAATHYVKAGFRNASEYAKATEQLFDAYMHVDNAKRESDPEKKTKFYAMAEKILQTSAGSFMKAEHPEKREQVLRLLEKVKEERELATSLCEVLHTPPIVSTTTTFGTPAPTHESAVGSERFEHADIQANIIARQRELKVGENLDLEIELVNAGKSTALLTKITQVIPEGFELKEKPENYRVEDSYINMKGKRLDPLKMEEVKLVLTPKVQGEFPLKPTILYLDENGKYKTHEPEPVTITVKELGIKGWIKGER